MTREDALAQAALPAAPDLAAFAVAWLAHLRNERRLAAHDAGGLRARRQAVSRLPDRALRRRRPPSSISSASPPPICARSWRAGARRRSTGARCNAPSRRLRSLARHIEREGGGTASAFAALRAPARRPPAAAGARASPTPGRSRRPPSRDGRSARAVGHRARRGRSGAALRRGLAYRRSAVDPPRATRRSAASTRSRSSARARKTRIAPVIAPVRAAIEDYLELAPMR